ncbi:MAG: glycogen-binding domain-containing protein [Bacteroidetes bacterium]|nr:glycogen-binding domain-containing protein [Bacteroidota bacterium]
MAVIVTAQPQSDQKDICRIDNNRMIFRLDRTWTAVQKKSVMKQFDLDSSLLASAFSGKPEITVSGIKWNVKKLDNNWVELSKPMGGGLSLEKGDVYMLDDRWINAAGIEERESAAFGINILTLYTVFNYHNGVATFFLPERKYARNVYIAGTFNNWSTMQTPMIRCDSGWFITLRLKPGKYTYKYIIDGKWSPDPYNKLRENDSQGGQNSVIFCYNYRFFLPFYKGSKKVLVAGSFNNWNPYELRLLGVDGGWALNLYLREGTHAYKFVVDGEWFLDPTNDAQRPDGMGHENSFLSIGDTMFFILKGHSAMKQVNVAGNFNAWNKSELTMKKVKDGWQLPYVLAAGNYEYKFILDGRWITDPDNPTTVGSGAGQNSFITIKPNHIFRLEGKAGARKVILTGSFNGWRNDGYEMMIKEDGTWVFPIFLKPGKHTYKFIVDGKWIIDPANELWEENQYGTGNSVLWIEP